MLREELVRLQRKIFSVDFFHARAVYLLAKAFVWHERAAECFWDVHELVNYHFVLVDLGELVKVFGEDLDDVVCFYV